MKTGSPSRSRGTASGSEKGGAPHRSVVAPKELSRPDRRQDILRSAELLFASRGFHAVSLRDIASHAGVPVALVGYYFGKKVELLRTIFDHRKAYILDRIEHISQVDCSTDNPYAVEDILKAWATPVISLRDDSNGEPFSVLVARTVWEPGDEATEIVTEFYDPLAETFIERMCCALPDAARDDIVWAYEYALGALLMLVADHRVERLSRDGARSGDPEQETSLIRFLSQGFRSIPRRPAAGQ